MSLACSCGAKWAGWTDLVKELKRNWKLQHSGKAHKPRKPYKPGQKSD